MAQSEEITEWYPEEKRIFAAFRRAGFEPKVVFDIGSSHAGCSDAINGVFEDADFHLFEPLVDYKPCYRKAVTGFSQDVRSLFLIKSCLE